MPADPGANKNIEVTEVYWGEGMMNVKESLCKPRWGQEPYNVPEHISRPHLLLPFPGYTRLPHTPEHCS